MAFSLAFEFPDSDEWQRIFDQTKKAIARAVELTAQALWGYIPREAPVDEGRLAGSFKIQKLSDLSWKIFTNVEYAEAIEKGTAPRVIVPTRARVLVFVVNGKKVFTRRVNHPGSRPNPYVKRSIDATRARAGEFVNRAIRESAAA